MKNKHVKTFGEDIKCMIYELIEYIWINEISQGF